MSDRNWIDYKESENGSIIARVRVHFDKDGYHWIDPWTKIHKDVLKEAIEDKEDITFHEGEPW